MKPLTTSIYTFPKLINGGFTYVDKTKDIYELLKPPTAQYFLSRPRRFGKSLLVSTLKAIFQGQKDLFEGLAIADTDYDWKSYPVIELNLGSCAADSADGLKTLLDYAVEDNAAVHGVSLERKGCAARFQELVNKTAQKNPVVILIDEYDKPLLGHLGKESAREIQDVLKSFYSVIKTTEPYQRFVLLTGVSRFSRVSIFSDLNNLTDLTMNYETATLLGYTQDELEANFADYIQRLADQEEKPYAQVVEGLRDWYNGYRFHHKAETVYNPVSVMKCLNASEYANYWFETGTPTFLVELLKRQPMDMEDLSIQAEAISTYDPNDLEPLPLLFQTGYLTIQGIEQIGEMRYYHLDYPNREIRQAFNYWLVRDFAEVPDPELSTALRGMVKSLQKCDIDAMLEHLKTFFANIPNTITLAHEKYYQTIFFTVFKLIGAMIEAEVNTNTGRIDAVVKTDKYIYIFEFKLGGTAEEAMQQIYDKQYAAPYRDDARTTTLVGVGFDRENRNIHTWLREKAES
mgnify:CR=1 FL=1